MDMKVRPACLPALLLGLLSFRAFAANVAGSWKGQLTDREGALHDVSFDLKSDGAKVTGTVAGMPPGSVQTIQKGALEGSELSFQISIGNPGGAPAQCTFTAQIAGNHMHGLITGPQGLRYTFTAGLS